MGGEVREDLNFYRPRLDQLWQIFGEDRLLYGSDWPNSDQWVPYEKVLGLTLERNNVTLEEGLKGKVERESNPATGIEQTKNR